MKKYLDRTCTAEERTRIIEYIKQSGNPREMDDLWKQVWNETDNTLKYDDLTWDRLLSLDKDKQKLATKSKYIVLWRWVAAAAVIAGVFWTFYWWNERDDLRIYQTGYGENIEFVLDDGTQINLNANSKLIWNNNWSSDGIRSVILEGEAFFNVAHVDMPTSDNENDRPEVGSAMPFEVITTDLTIKVLGTSFNAIQRRGKTEVYLEEGKVELALHSKQSDTGSQISTTSSRATETARDPQMNQEDNHPLAVVQMLPGEWVSYSSLDEELVQKSIDKLEPLTEWKEGTLSYQDVEFQFMLQNLEDIYGKNFQVIDSALLHKRVKIGVPFEDWQTVKEMMGWMLDIDVVELEDNLVRIEKRKEN